MNGSIDFPRSNSLIIFSHVSFNSDARQFYSELRSATARFKVLNKQKINAIFILTHPTDAWAICIDLVPLYIF